MSFDWLKQIPKRHPASSHLLKPTEFERDFLFSCVLIAAHGRVYSTRFSESYYSQTMFVIFN
jgi:hypothetical protein